MGLAEIVARSMAWAKAEVGRDCSYTPAGGSAIATRYVQERDAGSYADVDEARAADHLTILIPSTDVPVVSRLVAGQIGTQAAPTGDRVVIGGVTWWVVAILSDARESGGWWRLLVSAKATPGQ